MSSRQRLETANYYNDPRTREAFRTKRITVVEEHLERATVEVDLGDVTEKYNVLTSYEVCNLCRGRGTVIDPAFDCGGLTDEDFARDPGLRDDYFGGRCSMSCPECGGKRVTLNMTLILAQLPSETQVRLTELSDDDDEFLSVQMAELAFGC